MMLAAGCEGAMSFAREIHGYPFIKDGRFGATRSVVSEDNKEDKSQRDKITVIVCYCVCGVTL